MNGLVNNVFFVDCVGAHDNRVFSRYKKSRHGSTVQRNVRRCNNFGAHQQATNVFSGLADQGVAAVHSQTLNSFGKTAVHDGVFNRRINFGSSKCGIRRSNIEATFITDAAPPALLGTLKFNVGFFFAGFDSAFNGFFRLFFGRLVGRQTCRHVCFGVCKGVNGTKNCLLRVVHGVFCQLFGRRGLGFFVVGFGFLQHCLRCTQALVSCNHRRSSGNPDEVVALFNFLFDLRISHAVSSGIKSCFEIGLALPGSGVQFLFQYRQTYRVGIGAVHVRSGQTHCACLHWAVALGNSLPRLFRTRQHLAWGLRAHTCNRANASASQTRTGCNQRLYTLSRAVLRTFAHRRNNAFAQLGDAFVVAFELLNNRRKALNFCHVILGLCFFQFGLAKIQRVAHHLARLDHQRRGGVALVASAAQTKAFADACQSSAFVGAVSES